MTNSEATSNIHEHKQVPAWKNKSFWHITILIMACSVFYYMDVIINFGGWVNLKRDIFYTVHDLHRALFLIPVMYATYEFRLKGNIVTSFLSLLIFLPRALVVSPYPDPLLRASIFTISMIIMGVFLSLLLNSITRRKDLEQDLSLAQIDLLSKQVQEASRESEDKYKSLVDNIPDIIFTIDLAGKITFISKRAKEILGYENEETINVNIFNFIPEEDHQRAIENLQKGMKGEKVRHFQIPMIKKSGEILIFECSFTRVYKDGKVVGAQGTAVDITERKLAEEKFQESERKFREIVSNLDEGYYSVTLDGVLLEHNQAFSRILGFDQAADLKGKQMPDFWQNPDERKVYLQALAAKGSISNYQTNAKTKTGEKITVIISAHLVKDKDNLPLRIEGVFLDITKQKQYEDGLLASEERLRAIIDSTPFPMAIVDVQDNNIEYWSRSALSIFGHTAPTTTEWYQLAYPDPEYRREVIDRWKSFLEKARLTGKPLNTGEYRVSCHDGSARICELYATFLSEKLIVTFNDITERKQVEEALRKNEEMFQNMFRSHDAIMLLIDHNTGAIRDANQSAARFYGYSIERLCQMNIQEINTLSAEEVAHQRELAMEGKCNYFIFDHRLANGEVKTVEVHSSPIDTKSEKILFSVIHDITGRKQAEEELKKRENLLQKIFEVLPIGLWFADKDGNLLRGNPAGVKIWGAEPKVSLSEYGIFKARRLPHGEEIAPGDWALAHTIREGVTIVDETLEIDALTGRRRSSLITPPLFWMTMVQSRVRLSPIWTSPNLNRLRKFLKKITAF